MATVKKKVKKALNGTQQEPKPTYKNLKIGVSNKRISQGLPPKDGLGASKEDSAFYRFGYNRGLKGEKEYPGEPPVQKAGRWEGQNVPKKSAPKKKMKSGGSLGMKSVKAGFDKNPGVTRADIIVAGKGEAKYGKKVAKKSSKMKMGGKCKYGC